MVLTMVTKFTRLRPVHSIKHIVDLQGGLTAGAKTDSILVHAKDSPLTGTSAPDVEVGSTVGSIFLNVQVAAVGTAALANVYMYIMKNPGNNITEVNGNVVGVSDIRRWVIHQEMIMTEKNTTAIPRTLFKGVIKLPRGYKRFGIDDRLILSLFSPGVDYEFCAQCIYKELQ